MSLQRHDHHLKDAIINIAGDDADPPKNESPNVKPPSMRLASARASLVRRASSVWL